MKKILFVCLNTLLFSSWTMLPSQAEISCPVSLEKVGTIQDQGVTVTFGYDKRTDPQSEILAQESGEQRDYFVIVSGGGQSIKVPSKPLAAKHHLIQIAEMDRSNALPEVVFSNYYGGTHCCTEVQVITSRPDGSGWDVVPLGKFDGLIRTLFDSDGGEATPRLSDFDGNGTYEYLAYDRRFNYRFGAYAGDFPPLQIWGIEGLKVKNLSWEKSFETLHRATLTEMLKRINQYPDQPASNGVLAGYVATKMILGETKSGWELMMQRYNPKTTEGLSECRGESEDWLDDESLGLGEIRCDSGLVTYPSFPAALYHFLVETGYVP